MEGSSCAQLEMIINDAGLYAGYDNRDNICMDDIVRAFSVIQFRKGKYLGRPRLVTPKNFEEVYIKWKAKEITAVGAVSVLGISRSSFYKLVKLQEGTPEKC